MCRSLRQSSRISSQQRNAGVSFKSSLK
jgi:hypothetical protein